MRSLAIINPITPIAHNGGRLFLYDPKEAELFGRGGRGIALDFGVPVTIDAMFMGYHNAPANSDWSLAIADSYGGPPLDLIINGQSFDIGVDDNNRHSFARAAAPQTSRYWNIYTSVTSRDFYVGVAAIGLAWQAEWGHEWGAGRTIEDTGSSERLFGGGWATDDGVAASGYQWTFGDLQPDELQRLYRIVKDRRTTRSLLVVEDPDQTDGLNERLHWGLFRKLDAYERLDPLNTKWSLQIGDWA